MIDSKSVVQEVQKELLAALQRGQEQVRKGQDRVRKSQEQARKSRDAVVSVVRAGSELAKAARPGAPTLHIPSPATMRAHAQELAGQAIGAQRELATKARQAASPYTEHVATAQRALAGRVSEVAKVATPIVTEGVTRLAQLVSALQAGHTAAGSAEEIARETTPTSTATAAREAAEVSQPAAPEAQTPVKPKATTSRASAAKAGTTKTATTKTGTAKGSTTKASARPRASKPRSTEK